MEKEPRKASEVLLNLEAKIDVLMSIVRTQDLNIKILSNKVNSLLEKSDKTPAWTPSSIRIEAVDTAPVSFQQVKDANAPVSVSPEFSLPIEKEPEGFRRTSRPETYSGDNNFLKKPSVVTPKFPTQIPKLKEPEIIVPKSVMEFTDVPPQNNVKPPTAQQNVIPIIQRIVDKNGKSVFLADVEIIDAITKQTVCKTRTNGAGKWMISLAVGQYRVFVRKREALNKEKLEIVQDIEVTGKESPFNLQTVIIKS